MPTPVSAYLRKQAKLSGRSINQTIIDELSERAGITKDGKKQTLLESLDWFIGSGSDPEVTKILAEDDKQQKALAARKLTELGR